MKDTSEALGATCSDTTPRDRRNQIRFLLTLAVWAVCFSASSQLIKRELLPDGPAQWVAVAIAVAASLFAMLAYVRYLREADELQRLIQLQALALGFGGTFFSIAGYQLLQRLGAPAADPGDFTLVMAVFFTIGSLVGVWRYR